MGARASLDIQKRRQEAPGDTGRFDELVALLRETEEWRYVERETHVRLAR